MEAPKVDDIYNALSQKDCSDLKELMREGIALDAIEHNDESIIYEVIRQKNLNAISLMIVSSYNFKIKNQKGFTPLIYSIISHYKKAIELFIFADVSLDEMDALGRTPLMYSLIAANRDIFQLLIDHEVRTTQLDKQNRSALIYAAISQLNELGQLKIMAHIENEQQRKIEIKNYYKVILEGLNFSLEDITRKDKSGKMAIQYAAQKNNWELVEILSEYNSPLDVALDDGTLIIEQAIKFSKEEVVRFFIKDSKNLDAPCSGKYTVRGLIEENTQISHILSNEEEEEEVQIISFDTPPDNDFQKVSGSLDTPSENDVQHISGGDVDTEKENMLIDSSVEHINDKISFISGAPSEHISDQATRIKSASEKISSGSLFDNMFESFEDSFDEDEDVDEQEQALDLSGESSKNETDEINTDSQLTKVSKKIDLSSLQSGNSKFIAGLFNSFSDTISNDDNISDNGFSKSKGSTKPKINQEIKNISAKNSQMINESQPLNLNESNYDLEDGKEGSLKQSNSEKQPDLTADIMSSKIQDIRSGKTKVDEVNPKGLTLLMIISGKGDLKGVQQLIQMKAKINKKDRSGRTALMFAIVKGHDLVAKELLQFDADTEIKDKNLYTSLFFAIKAKRKDLMILLLEFGAKRTHKIKGQTALMLAASFGYKEGVEVILNLGADPKEKDFKGKIAADYALNKKHKELANFLRRVKRKSIIE